MTFIVVPTGRTDGPTDRRTDRRTDTSSYIEMYSRIWKGGKGKCLFLRERDKRYSECSASSILSELCIVTSEEWSKGENVGLRFSTFSLPSPFPLHLPLHSSCYPLLPPQCSPKEVTSLPTLLPTLVPSPPLFCSFLFSSFFSYTFLPFSSTCYFIFELLLVASPIFSF